MSQIKTQFQHFPSGITHEAAGKCCNSRPDPFRSRLSEDWYYDIKKIRNSYFRNWAPGMMRGVP